MTKKYYIGAMSGTSFDAIDISVIGLKKGITLEFFHSKKIPSQIKSKIRNLINNKNITLSELGKLDKQIGSLFSLSIQECIYKNKIKTSSIGCIAISGQTICHEIHKKNSFSMQIGDPNTLAALTGIDVIADFRRKDIALGGQRAAVEVVVYHNGVGAAAARWRAEVSRGGRRRNPPACTAAATCTGRARNGRGHSADGRKGRC